MIPLFFVNRHMQAISELQFSSVLASVSMTGSPLPYPIQKTVDQGVALLLGAMFDIKQLTERLFGQVQFSDGRMRIEITVGFIALAAFVHVARKRK